jgi:ABC-type transporter Mla MlaB component
MNAMAEPLAEVSATPSASVNPAAGSSSGSSVLPTQLRAGQAADVFARVAGQLSQRSAGESFRVDLSRLDGFDSAALAVLVALLRTSLAGGVRLELVDAPANLRKLAALYGLEDVLFEHRGPVAVA